MKEVFQLDKTAVGDKAVVYLGGEDADNNWPINPMGENLKLIMTFKNNSINKILGEPLLPDGKYTSVFSSYNENRYFLDDIVYFGDQVEFDYIRKGFTQVIMSDEPYIDTDKSISISAHSLSRRSLDENVFAAFSFFSTGVPNGIKGCDKLLSDYVFLSHVYSSDVPSKDGGALGLSDAVGCLLIKKNVSDLTDAGFFFVQTA